MSSTAIDPSRPAPRTSDFAIGAIVEEPDLHGRLVLALDAAGFELCARASSAEDLAGTDHGLDLVVLYQRADRVASVAAVRLAKEAFPDTPLIAIWSASNADDARRALRAGADGLVSEGAVETALAPTIRAVRSGLVCVPSRMRAPLESESLSMREKQVLGMIVMGLSNAEIATKLYLAESTVKSHLSSAYNKLGVCSRKDAASMILDPTEGLGPGILAISAA